MKEVVGEVIGEDAEIFVGSGAGFGLVGFSVEVKVKGVGVEVKVLSVGVLGGYTWAKRGDSDLVAAVSVNNLLNIHIHNYN